MPLTTFDRLPADAPVPAWCRVTKASESCYSWAAPGKLSEEAYNEIVPVPGCSTLAVYKPPPAKEHHDDMVPAFSDYTDWTSKRGVPFVQKSFWSKDSKPKANAQKAQRRKTAVALPYDNRPQPAGLWIRSGRPKVTPNFEWHAGAFPV